MKLAQNTYLILCFFLLTGVTNLNKGNFGIFQRSLNNTSHGYQIIPDPTGTAPVKYVEKFEVRPGDCSSNSTWNDCSNDRERSELSERYKTTKSGSEFWYGWSVYFPMDYTNVYPTKVALGQFHQQGSHVIWMFQNSNGGYHIDNQVRGHSEKYDILIPEKELRGKWHKIEIHVKWDTKYTGFMKVWVNGIQKSNFEGRTMDASRVYFKYGLYRSYLSRYKRAENKTDVPAQTVYFANVKRGKTRKDLEP